MLSQDYENYKTQLEKWEAFLGLPKYEPERSEIESILQLKNEDLQAISSIQIAEYAFMLSQYAFFLQQKTNECKSFLDWARGNEKRLTNIEDKSKMASWVKEVKMRESRVAYLTRRVEMMVQCLSNLGRVRYQEKNNESN